MPPTPARSPQSVPGGEEGEAGSPHPTAPLHSPAGRQASSRQAGSRAMAGLLPPPPPLPPAPAGSGPGPPLPVPPVPSLPPAPASSSSSAPGRADTGLTASGAALKYIHITYTYNTHIYLYIYSVQVVVADSQPPQREVAGGCSPGAQVEAFCSWSSAFADFFPRNYCERKSGVEGLPPVPRSISAPCGSCGMLGSVGVVLAS